MRNKVGSNDGEFFCPKLNLTVDSIQNERTVQLKEEGWESLKKWQDIHCRSTCHEPSNNEEILNFPHGLDVFPPHKMRSTMHIADAKTHAKSLDY